MRVKFDKNDFPFSKLLQHDQNIKVLLISILILFTYYKTLARGNDFCPALYKITKMDRFRIHCPNKRKKRPDFVRTKIVLGQVLLMTHKL